jgi:hypothetical protein
MWPIIKVSKDSLWDKGKLVAKMIVRNHAVFGRFRRKVILLMSFKILPSR